MEHMTWHAEQALQFKEEKVRSAVSVGLLLNPNVIAREYLGIKFKMGNIMNYCFRRFGYPAFGWYGPDELCSWIITTPMDGVFLGVIPSDVSPFRVCCYPALYDNISNEADAGGREWGYDLRMLAWQAYGKILMTPFSKKGFFKKAVADWLLHAELKDKRPPEELEQEFWEFKDKERTKVIERIKKDFDLSRNDYPWPPDIYSDYPNVPEKPFYEGLSKKSLLRQGCEALAKSMNDLLIPTYIRDAGININGRKTIGADFVEPFELAGCGVGFTKIREYYGRLRQPLNLKK